MTVRERQMKLFKERFPEEDFSSLDKLSDKDYRHWIDDIRGYNSGIQPVINRIQRSIEYRKRIGKSKMSDECRERGRKR